MAAKNIHSKEFQELLAREKPVLADFWAPWCGYCRRIAPAFDRIAQQFAHQLEAVKINIDEDPLLASQQQIDVIPTLVLYRSGEAVATLVAPDSGSAIEAFLREHLEQ